MVTGFYIFFVGAAIVSIGRTLEVRKYLVSSRIDPAFNIATTHRTRESIKRDLDYSGQVNVDQNQHSVGSNLHHYNNEYKYTTESDHVALISKKVKSEGEAGSDNGFRLRTNVDANMKFQLVDHVIEYVKAGEQHFQTHRNENERDILNKSFDRENLRSQLRHHGSTQLIAKNGDIDKEEPHAPNRSRTYGTFHLTKNPVRHNESPKSNTNVNNGHTKSKPLLQNVTVETDSDVQSQTNIDASINVTPTEVHRLPSQGVREIGTEKNKGIESERQRKNKNEGEEIPWVWSSGTDENSNTTDVDLANRVAFDGSMCPTDYVKVMGVCVKKH